MTPDRRDVRRVVTYEESIAEIAEKLIQSSRLLFITGAGISAESGLPVYRGVGGLYDKELTDMNLPIEEVLSGAMMRAHPEVTWKYILEIEKACRGAKYNRAHKIIAELEHYKEVWVLTQNIDGFHKAAGSSHVIDIHGDIHEILCTGCDFQQTVKDYTVFQSIPPKCPKCGSILRPDVVLFGELLPPEKLRMLEEEKRKGFDMVFSIGTTSIFPYISAPVYEARSQNIPTIEINPGRTEITEYVDYKLNKTAVQSLSDIYSIVQDLAPR